MQTNRTWLCLHLVWITTAAVDMEEDQDPTPNPRRTGSSPSSRPAFTKSEVGLEAVLPCSCLAQRKGGAEPPYIQWQSADEVVFERLGREQFQGEGYGGRADVPERALLNGDCTLRLRDTRLGDAGVYESYLVVGGESYKKRIFIQSVQLSVLDHKSEQSLERGKDLTLELYTDQAKALVFRGSSAPVWTRLWQRGRSDDSLDSRVEEMNKSLVIKNVRGADEGTYKVTDGDGLALSTVKISVTEPVRSTEEKKNLRRPAMRVALDSSVGRNSPPVYLSTLLLLLLLYLL